MGMRERKQRFEPAIPREAGFPAMGPLHYLPYLRHLHESRHPKVYFEIGTESGASLSYAGCTSVAVDPAFAIDSNVVGTKPALHLFQGTSDAFFGSGLLDRLGLTIDLAFLDGMHHVEFLLRDFMHTERHMDRDGMIVLHDCVPFSRIGADRVWRRRLTKSWTGDVWKLLPILAEHRPDLRVEVLDLQPSGLVCITRLDPASEVLAHAYEAIVATYRDMTLDDFGLDRLWEVTGLKPASLPAPAAVPAAVIPPVDRTAELQAADLRYARWTEPPAPAADRLRIAIKTESPVRRRNWQTGDFHLARGLADGFLRLGHAVRIDARHNWYDDRAGTDVELFLHGEGPFEPQEGIPLLVWVLYPGRGDGTLPDWLERAAHIWVASGPDAARQAARFGRGRVSALLQGHDPAQMYPESPRADGPLVFVGSNHFHEVADRAIVSLALETGTEIDIWGKAWRQHPAAKHLRGRYKDNHELGDLYRASAAVLCDHMPAMRQAGYVSNRVFDALACARPVIVDDVQGLPEDVLPFVHVCRDAGDFAAAVAAVRAEDAAMAARRAAFAQDIDARHSLHARAATIAAHMQALRPQNRLPAQVR
jgi:hypothetical protein